MKYFLFLSFLITTTNLCAQKVVDQTIESIKNGDYKTPEQRCAELDAVMRDKLALRQDQAGPVHDINLRYAQRAENEVVKADIGNWSKYRRLMAMQKEKDKEMKKVLTPQQFEQYTEARDAAVWKAMKAVLF